KRIVLVLPADEEKHLGIVAHRGPSDQDSVPPGAGPPSPTPGTPAGRATMRRATAPAQWNAP
ncbi:MAG: hypothetical protein WAN93_07570, partial [Solirubrobacteraceae bacterium]